MRSTGVDPEALTDRFFEVTRDLVCVIDEERIVRANHRWSDLLGWDLEELTARPFMDFVHPDDREDTSARVAQVRGGADLPLFEHRIATKQGSWRVLSWSARLDRETGLTLGSARDVTDERRAEVERARINSVLNALGDLQASYIESGMSRGWWQSALDHMIELTSSEFGFVGRVVEDEEGSPFLLSYAVTDIAWNEWSRQHYDTFVEQGLEFHSLETLFGETLRTGELVISHDPLHDPRSGGLPEGHPPLLAYLGMPLADDNGMVGMVGLANRPGGFDEDLVDLLSPLNALLSQIISRDVMAERAQTDPLTGLPNRTAFTRRVEELFGANNRRRQGVGLLLLDLDGFKDINDTLGHLEGDRVLSEVASLAAGTLRHDDMIARLGGDEFAVLLAESTAEELERTGLRLRDAITGLRSAAGDPIGVSIGGIWVQPGDSSPLDWESTYGKADARLYEAKRAGGSAVVVAGD
ncbi:MAG: diguanylate cyclase [Actinomycetes bacterium]